MIKILRQFIILWVILIICMVSFLFYFGHTISKIKTEIIIRQENNIDSLKKELKGKEFEISRYEIILDELQNKNPKLFDEIIHNVE